MKTNFIELKLGSHVIIHGFDKDNKEIKEEVTVSEFTSKLVAIDRIKSIGEKYVLIDYLHERWVYWEYEGSFEGLKNKLL